MSKQERVTLDLQRWGEIKLYTRTHTIAETAKKFDVSTATVTWIRRYDSFNEMRENRNRIMRNYKTKRKVETKPHKKLFSPFSKNIEPKLKIPAGAERAPEQNGAPVTVNHLTPPKRVKAEDKFDGLTLTEWSKKVEKYRDEHNKLMDEIKELRAENTLDKAKIDALQNELKEKPAPVAQPVLVGEHNYSSDFIYVISGTTKIVIPIRGKE